MDEMMGAKYSERNSSYHSTSFFSWIRFCDWTERPPVCPVLHRRQKSSMTRQTERRAPRCPQLIGKCCGGATSARNGDADQTVTCCCWSAQKRTNQHQRIRRKISWFYLNSRLKASQGGRRLYLFSSWSLPVNKEVDLLTGTTGSLRWNVFDDSTSITL